MTNLAAGENTPFKNQNSKIDPKFAAYVFMVIIFCSVLFRLIIGGVAVSSGVDLADFLESSVAMIILYVLFAAAFFIISAQLRLHGREIPHAVDLYVNKKVSMCNIGLVLLAACLVLVSFDLLIEGFAEIFGMSSTEMQIGGIPEYIMAVFVLCLLPAIVEELLFRGFILKGLVPLGAAAAVIASAFLFTIFHMSPEQTLYQFILGVVLAVVVLRTGNLLYAMILHFLNNFLVLTAYTFFGVGAVGLSWNAVTVVTTCVLAVLGGLMIVGVCKALKRDEPRAETAKLARFFSFDNVGFFIAAALGICVWIIELLSRGGTF